MATTLIPSQGYSIGDHLLADIKNIPASQDGIRVMLTRESWPIGPVLSLSVSGRVGGAASGGAQAVFEGGEIIGRNGEPLTEAVLEWQWPGENDGQGNRRVIRVTDVEVRINVIQQINTAVTVDTFAVSV